MFRSRTANEYPIIIPYLFNGYKVIRFLGNGFSCITVLVEKEDTNQQFAAKIISKRDIENQHMMNSIMNEINILKTLNHPNIIKFYEALTISNDFDEEFIVIITEFCPNGDLFDFICKHDFKDEIEKKKVIFGILKAVQYIHKRGIFHCDIKLENILLDHQMIPKLCDFGDAKSYLISNGIDNFGTLRYASPERLKKGSINLMKSDIYSMGITLFALSEKYFPFNCDDEGYMAYQIKNGYLSLNPDDDLQYIVGKCTKFNPDDRISIDDLLADQYFLF